MSQPKSQHQQPPSPTWPQPGTSKQQWLLKREMQLLQAAVGSLGDIPTIPSPFVCQWLGEEQGGTASSSAEGGSNLRIKVRTDSNSNVRLFGYCLLSLCFERCKDSDYAQEVLAKFKSVVYAETLRLDTFAKEEMEPVFRQYYSTPILKKAMVEFLQIMQFYTKDSVLEMLQRYPIIDTILVLIFRSALGSRTIKYTTTKTALLAEYFAKILGVRILYNPTSKEYAFLGTRLVVDQDSDEEWSFVCEEELTKAVRSKNSSLVPAEFEDEPTQTFSLQVISDQKYPGPHHKSPNKLARQSLQERDSSLHKSALYADHRANGSLEPTADANVLRIPKRDNYEKRISGQTPTQGVCLEDDILVIPKRLNLTEQAEEDYQELMQQEMGTLGLADSPNTVRVGGSKKLSDLYSPQNHHFSGYVASFGEQFERVQREERQRILSKSTIMESYPHNLVPSHTNLQPNNSPDFLHRKQSLEPSFLEQPRTTPALEMLLARQKQSPSKLKSFGIYSGQTHSGSNSNNHSASLPGQSLSAAGSPKHYAEVGTRMFPHLIKTRPKQ